MKVAIVIGTRPEIIKMSKIMLIAKEHPDIEPLFVHTGQHYSYNMSQQFMEELELPKIDYNIEVGSGTPGQQTGEMIKKLDELFMKENPDVVLIQGDTNSCLAGALAATKIHLKRTDNNLYSSQADFENTIKVGHIEAGIRSNYRYMPEEINRILCDQISDYCFAPTSESVSYLKKENIEDSRIFLTGNPIVEAVQRGLELAKTKSNIHEKLGLEKENYLLVTAHRAENVDIKERLLGLVKAFEQIKMPIVYPIHPRTIDRLKKLGLYERVKAIKNLKLIDPIGYFDFLSLSANAKVILTDSGGIQEESTVYKKPVLVARDNTERPEALGTFGRLVGCNTEKILNNFNDVIENYDMVSAKLKETESPFGDGTASQKIIDIILKGNGD